MTKSGKRLRRNHKDLLFSKGERKINKRYSYTSDSDDSYCSDISANDEPDLINLVDDLPPPHAQSPFLEIHEPVDGDPWESTLMSSLSDSIGNLSLQDSSYMVGSPYDNADVQPVQRTRYGRQINRPYYLNAYELED